MYTIKEVLEGNMQDSSLVVFSGGIDSTLVLLQEVDRIKEAGKGNINVIYLQPKGAISTKKADKELETVKTIVAKINKDNDMDIKINLLSQCSSVVGSEYNRVFTDGTPLSFMLPQSIMWTGSILTLLPQIAGGKLNILFGFNLADNCHFHSACLMKKVIEEQYKLLIMGNENTVINVAFPLISSTKENIYTRMLEKYYDYFNLTWTCEIPDDGEECGYCTPCKTKYQTLKVILQEHRKTLKEDLVECTKDVNKLFTIKKNIRDGFDELDKV